MLMMKRAARRRKRNKPPGPCGVLWEMSKSKVPMLEEEELTHNNETKVALFSEESTNDTTVKKKRTEEQYDRSMPAAWQAMQRSLDITTPYLPLHTRGNVQKRYELLRPHLPENCILLPEILNGSHDLKIADDNKYLCVWVDAVEERNSHHGIWTVELKDETGASIRAWMEPNFVKEELQKAQKGDGVGVVRIGVVWMLSDLSMIAIHTNSNNSNEVERMLVVSGKRILKVWTPESDRAQNQPLEEEDSPEAQRKYLDWMEKRNALTVDDESPVDNNANKDEIEDEMDEEDIHDDRCHRNSSREREARLRRSDNLEGNGDCRHIVGGTEQQERMTELSALTMTADDENIIATSAHDRNDAIPPRLTHRASPLVDRNVNKSNDENLLQTQESAPLKNKLHDTNCDDQHGQNHPSGNLHNDRLLTQPNQSQKNVDCNNQRNSMNRNIGSSQGLSPHKRKKRKMKKNKDSSSPLPNRTTSPKRCKRNRTCNSPIRMSHSVWNTPDPSILQMLEEESDDNADEEEEAPTVIGGETSLSFAPTTQATNNIQTETNLPASAEISIQPGIEEASKEKVVGDEPLMLTGKALLGGNLFEPSNWKGVDSTAFNESDSE